MNRWLLVVLGMTVPVVVMIGCRRGWSSLRGEYHDTVLPGTWTWDIESDTLGPRRGVDFHWRQVSETVRYLVPENGTQVAIAIGKNLEETDAAFVRAQKLSIEWLSGSDVGGVLNPGAVVVFRTAQGNLGKLRIERYRTAHDFSFPEAARLAEGWKSHIVQRPDTERYHVQVKWFLFQ